MSTKRPRILPLFLPGLDLFLGRPPPKAPAPIQYETMEGQVLTVDLAPPKPRPVPAPAPDSDFTRMCQIKDETDPAKRKRLIQAFATDKIPLARAFARRWRSTGTDQRDVVQAAILGVMVAIDGWDPSKAGGGFSSYCHRCMASAILRGPIAAQSPAHVPRTIREDRRRVDKALVKGTDPDPEALALATGLPQSRVTAALGWVNDRDWDEIPE